MVAVKRQLVSQIRQLVFAIMSAFELGTEPSRPRSRRSPSYCLQLKRAKSEVSKLSAMLGSGTHMELADNLAVSM